MTQERVQTNPLPIDIRIRALKIIDKKLGADNSHLLRRLTGYQTAFSLLTGYAGHSVDADEINIWTDEQVSKVSSFLGLEVKERLIRDNHTDSYVVEWKENGGCLVAFPRKEEPVRFFDGHAQGFTDAKRKALIAMTKIVREEGPEIARFTRYTQPDIQRMPRSFLQKTIYRYQGSQAYDITAGGQQLFKKSKLYNSYEEAEELAQRKLDYLRREIAQLY